jgi:hypothetical protein
VLLRFLRRAMEVEHVALDFPAGQAAYNGIGRLGDTIWFAVSTKSLASGARLYAFDGTLRVVAGDLLRTPGAIPQGKVHVDLAAVGGRLIGATHIGYYDPRSRVETPGSAPGLAPYPGGYFFAIENGRVIPLAQAPQGEGIITMSADAERRMLFALTWPRGLFLTYDFGTLTNHGAVFGSGETGSKTWTRICRSIGIEPATGHAFWCDEAGRITRFDGAAMEVVATTPRRELWRKVVWHDGAFYGAGWRSGALFRFDPRSRACVEIGRLRQPATLAFAITGNVIHTLAHGVVHMTHDVTTGATRTSGPLRLRDGRWVTEAQSLLIIGDVAYSVCWAGREIVLIRFTTST